MYEQHFGLIDRPFALTPDPRFWFDSATHRKAMSYLGYGLQQGEGFIVITGEIGAGKTTLVEHLVGRIDPARVTVLRLVSTAVAAEDLLRTVAAGLGVDGEGLSKAELLKRIERGLHAVARTGRRTLLIVDEAQALPVDSLEELRMLSNFQAGGHAMLQILLLGQPEFRDRLNGSDALEQLRQRVIALHHLEPMEADEIEGYVGRRLQVAGWEGRPDFTDAVFPRLFEATAGVPRRLNQLMGRVLLQAAVSGTELIDADLIDQVLSDTARDTAAPRVAPAEPVRAAPVVPIAEAPAAVSSDPALVDRVSQLEARIEEQDAALRRVLTLLVDWVEGDQREVARHAA